MQLERPERRCRDSDNVGIYEMKDIDVDVD